MKYQCDYCGQYDSLSNMYFCPTCNRLVCSSLSCIHIAVEYLFCHQCLDTPPVSESRETGYRCMKCYQCPRCQNKVHPLASSQKNPTNLPMLSWTCFGCGWNSVDSGLMAENREELLAETEKRIAERSKRQDQALSEIALDIQSQLGLRRTGSTPYKMPISMEEEKQKEEEEKKDNHRRDEMAVNLLSKEFDYQFPVHPALGSKRKLFCRHCNDQGSGLLCLPQSQPLVGDSTLRLGNGNWFRKGCFAMYALPVITLVQKKENSTVLRIRNVYSFFGADARSQINGEMTITFTIPVVTSCIVPSYDPFSMDQSKLETLNVGKMYVQETGVDYVLIELPGIVKDIELSCTYGDRTSKPFSRTLHLRLD